MLKKLIFILSFCAIIHSPSKSTNTVITTHNTRRQFNNIAIGPNFLKHTETYLYSRSSYACLITCSALIVACIAYLIKNNRKIVRNKPINNLDDISINLEKSFDDKI